MKKIIGFLAAISLIASSQDSVGQMIIDNSQTPTQLVQDVLVGEGVQISGINFVGNSEQIGYFDATNADFPISRGIVMSSGNVNDVPATGATFASTAYNGGGDPDLDLISGINSSDAAILSFDFVPNGDSINFNYVFGSEEYPEYVNAGFNDVFGFVISGPGFAGPYSNGGENIALIPGTTTPVSIDNVNVGMNSEYYVDNQTGGANGVVYDAYTTVLTARASVICGETYTIKLMVSDGYDAFVDEVFDSGVFLEAESFSSNAFRFDIVTPSGDSTVVEGCTDAVVNIFSPPSDSLLAYDIIVSGNAIDGVDFTGIPDSLIIQPGDSIFSFTIDPLEDAVTENEIDTIFVTIYTINSCGDSIANQGVIYIVENYEIDVEIADAPGPCTDYDYSILSSTLSTGNPPFEYHWSTGDVTPTIEVGFAITTDVSLYVVDQCGVISDTAVVTVPPGEAPPQPTLQVSNDVTLDCPGDDALLTAIADNGSDPYTYAWSNGGNASTVTVSPSETTDYIIIITDNCLLSAQDTITVTVEPYVAMELNISDTTVACPGDEVLLESSFSGGNDPFDYSWSSGGNGASTTLNPQSTTVVTLTVEDDCGMTVSDDATITVPELDPLTASILNADLLEGDTVVVCEFWTDTLSSSVTGGLLPYAYQWNGMHVVSDGIQSEAMISIPYELEPDSSVSGVYSLTVTDACDEQVIVDVPVDFISCDIVQPGIFNPNSDFAGNADICGNNPQNNVFNLPCLELYPGNTMTIFDRWGRKCYQVDDYHLAPWDGGNQATGTYFYVCELPGNKEAVKGYFQLVR